jgi:hypothetical protein
MKARRHGLRRSNLLLVTLWFGITSLVLLPASSSSHEISPTSENNTVLEEALNLNVIIKSLLEVT